MHKHIKLTNERLSIVDLSPLLDAAGQRLVLQPKGAPKSTKECDAGVLQHPHVIGYLNATPPWLSWSPVTVEEAAPPAAPPEPPKEPEAPPADLPKEPEAPPAASSALAEEVPVEEVPAEEASTETSNEEPDAMASVETTNLDETVATGESLSLEVTTPSSSDTRSGKRNRNR